MPIHLPDWLISSYYYHYFILLSYDIYCDFRIISFSHFRHFADSFHFHHHFMLSMLCQPPRLYFARAAASHGWLLSARLSLHYCRCDIYFRWPWRQRQLIDAARRQPLVAPPIFAAFSLPAFAALAAAITLSLRCYWLSRDICQALFSLRFRLIAGQRHYRQVSVDAFAILAILFQPCHCWHAFSLLILFAFAAAFAMISLFFHIFHFSSFSDSLFSSIWFYFAFLIEYFIDFIAFIFFILVCLLILILFTIFALISIAAAIAAALPLALFADAAFTPPYDAIFASPLRQAFSFFMPFSHCRIDCTASFRFRHFYHYFAFQPHIFACWRFLLFSSEHFLIAITFFIIFTSFLSLHDSFSVIDIFDFSSCYHFRFADYRFTFR